MTLVRDIIARLLELQTVFKTVGGAADFSLIEKRRSGTPAAYVMVADEASGENERVTGRILQRLETDIAVVIVTDNLSGARMGQAADDIEGLKAFVRARLIGFEPSDAAEPVSHISGDLIKAHGGAVWFEDRYSVPTYLEEQP
ncbi:hypothetical protein J0X15_12480 [Roseibium sp. CAU 1637]|uniref:Uncharacterized protein n=1 Tax=Roseibium limicola TaxID=2816037 RepID=A0A939J960_9HYPH|nr:hypothetical protein [Roseibium limicola]MBO0346041.1 hypothetical protein [Roseibium limicola]